jgi:nitrogen fixation/metabolism regulation signal transduction histidine kinase
MELLVLNPAAWLGRRAKTSENISAAVLSNLSSGVLFLTTNGLIRIANARAAA